MSEFWASFVGLWVTIDRDWSTPFTGLVLSVSDGWMAFSDEATPEPHVSIAYPLNRILSIEVTGAPE